MNEEIIEELEEISKRLSEIYTRDLKTPIYLNANIILKNDIDKIKKKYGIK